MGDSLCCLRFDSPTDSTDIHRFYIFQYPCSSVLFVGDFLCCLRFILPQIPQIFTDFIYSNIRAPLCYLWNTPSHPISVFICAICGRFLRTLTYVGDSLCSLRFDSPTDSTDFHRFYISQYPCSSVLSVEHTFAPNIRVHLCYLWEIPSHPDICGRFLLLLEIYSPTDSTDFHRFYISQNPCSSALFVENFPVPNIRVNLRYLWEPPSAA